jgi:gliding motility associated protien GldN
LARRPPSTVDRKKQSMKKLFFALAILSISAVGFTQPLNDITNRGVVREKPVLKYPPIREADIMWEKRIWRVLDVREKINKPFAYPEASFFEILTSAAEAEEIQLYSTETDDFSQELSIQELNDLLFKSDTISVWDPVTYVKTLQVVQNKINDEDVKRFRIKETWLFDSQTATMKVRILGIAPMIEVHDDNGNFRYEKPLFWIHYPSSRNALARETVFNTGNDSSRMTWEDLFEMRRFSSYIYRESNVGDYKLDEHYAGVDLLLQADKIERTIFNYEHDLWSY